MHNETQGMRNQQLTAREERHALNLPVRYRLHHEDWWTAAIVENLSATGVLFHADREITIGSAIIIDIRFLADRPIRIVRPGSVVRLTHAPLARHPWIIAAKLGIEGMHLCDGEKT